MSILICESKVNVHGEAHELAWKGPQCLCTAEAQISPGSMEHGAW